MGLGNCKTSYMAAIKDQLFHGESSVFSMVLLVTDTVNATTSSGHWVTIIATRHWYAIRGCVRLELSQILECHRMHMCQTGVCDIVKRVRSDVCNMVCSNAGTALWPRVCIVHVRRGTYAEGKFIV